MSGRFPRRTKLGDEQRSERIRAAVRSLALFRALPEEQLERLAGIAGLRDGRKGETLWSAGDPAEALTVILLGRVKVVRHGAGGDVILNIFGPGEPVGAVAVQQRVPYPATAIALEPVALLTLPASDYFDLLEREPRFAQGMLGAISRMTATLSRKVEDMRAPRVEARIAQLFVSLAGRMGERTDEGIVIAMGLSRQEVAELIGTTVESAIRVLSRWGREGVLVTGTGRFVVPSLDVLKAIAEGRAEG
jgi:CRP/FNR family transcriptional regulator